MHTISDGRFLLLMWIEAKVFEQHAPTLHELLQLLGADVAVAHLVQLAQHLARIQVDGRHS